MGKIVGLVVNEPKKETTENSKVEKPKEKPKDKE